MSVIAFFIGALGPTFLLSRLALWLTKGGDGGVRRLVLCHLMALMVAGLIGGIGMADGGAFAGMQAVTAYAIPQAAWLALDLWRHKRTRGSSPVGNA